MISRRKESNVFLQDTVTGKGIDLKKALDKIEMLK